MKQADSDSGKTAQGINADEAQAWSTDAIHVNLEKLHGASLSPAAVSSQSTSSRTARSRLGSVQSLRAFAALCVMFSHIIGDIVYHGGPSLFRSYFLGAAGVDLFFVISGFVMVHSTLDRFARKGARIDFISARLARIIPLYWISTISYCLIQIGQGKWLVVKPGIIIASLFLWPIVDIGGAHPPIYGIGWTLNFEMFFYVVFATGLGLPRPTGLLLIATSLLGLVLVGALLPLPGPLRFWSQPILVDFLFGMALAAAFQRGWRLAPSLALTISLASLAVLAWTAEAGFNFDPFSPNVTPRWLIWGLPCTGIFAGVVLRIARHPKRLSIIDQLGDASYAIYLVHPMVIIGLRPMLPLLEAIFPGKERLAAGVQVVLVSMVVIGTASLVHLTVERPIARLMTRRRLRSGRMHRSSLSLEGSMAEVETDSADVRSVAKP